MATKWSSYVATKYPGVRRRPDGRFVVQVRVNDGKGRTRPRTMTLPEQTTLEGAVVARAQLAEGMRREIFVAEGREAPILSDYAKLWLKRKKRDGLRKHTLDSYVANLEKHVLPFLGDKRVDEISSRDILEWKDKACARRLKTGKLYAGWSMGTWFQILRNIVSDIVVEFELPRNPCDGIRAPKKPKAPRRERTLNAEQLREFLRLVKLHCPQHHAITLMLVLYGLRWEEASALHWEHIDEEAMELHIVQTQVQRRVYPTKNENNKLLPLVPVVLEAIREHDEMSRVRRNPRKTKGIVFPARNGNYRLPSSVSAGWKVISRAMNLKWNVAPHDLRRSYQNMLRKASVNMIIQQAMMGHSSEAMTEHYSHVDMEEKRKAHKGVVDLLNYKKDKAEDK